MSLGLSTLTLSSQPMQSAVRHKNENLQSISKMWRPTKRPICQGVVAQAENTPIPSFCLFHPHLWL